MAGSAEQMSGSKGDRGQSNSAIEILGVKIHCVNFAQTLDQIERWVNGAEVLAHPEGAAPSPLHQICTVNPEFIMAARRDPHFAAVLRAADLCVPDGVGVVWAAQRQGVQLRERVTGSDGIYRICERAAERGWRVFFLGAAAGVAAEAARRLQQLYPGLQIAGVYSGSPHAQEWPTIAAQLQATHPDILFVAYGHPRQDFWIAQHRHELPAKVAIGVGGAFDFVAGVTARAPGWMQRAGIEWLYRLIQQPWRWRRMTVLPLFVLYVWLAPRVTVDNA